MKGLVYRDLFTGDNGDELNDYNPDWKLIDGLGPSQRFVLDGAGNIVATSPTATVQYQNLPASNQRVQLKFRTNFANAVEAISLLFHTQLAWIQTGGLNLNDVDDKFQLLIFNDGSGQIDQRNSTTFNFPGGFFSDNTTYEYMVEYVADVMRMYINGVLVFENAAQSTTFGNGYLGMTGDHITMSEFSYETLDELSLILDEQFTDVLGTLFETYNPDFVHVSGSQIYLNGDGTASTDTAGDFQYVYTPKPNANQEVSFDFVTNFPAPRNYYSIAFKCQPGFAASDDQFYIEIFDDGSANLFSNGPYSDTLPPGTFNDAETHNLRARYRNGKIKVWLDGNLLATYNAATTNFQTGTFGLQGVNGTIGNLQYLQLDIIDTFTDADNTDLPTHDPAYSITNGAGLPEIINDEVITTVSGEFYVARYDFVAPFVGDFALSIDQANSLDQLNVFGNHQIQFYGVGNVDNINLHATVDGTDYDTGVNVIIKGMHNYKIVRIGDNLRFYQDDVLLFSVDDPTLGDIQAIGFGGHDYLAIYGWTNPVSNIDNLVFEEFTAQFLNNERDFEINAIALLNDEHDFELTGADPFKNDEKDFELTGFISDVTDDRGFEIIAIPFLPRIKAIIEQ